MRTGGGLQSVGETCRRGGDLGREKMIHGREKVTQVRPISRWPACRWAAAAVLEEDVTLAFLEADVDHWRRSM